jgi:hypothetical protein
MISRCNLVARRKRGGKELDDTTGGDDKLILRETCM